MKKVMKVILPLVLIVAIIASIGWYLFVYDRDFTRDMLLDQARYHNENGNPDLASWFYGLAYNYTAQDEDIAIELAEQYKKDGNYTKAEYTLSNAISDGGTVDLYIALCKTYVEQDKLLDAVQMLNNITDPAISAEIDKLRPLPPFPDHEPGFYSQYISVGLSSDNNALYCTANGEYPSTEDCAYVEAIPLEVGETTITAVAVGENGLVSALAVLKYTVGGVVEPVNFADDAMKTAICELLNVDTDTVIYTNDLWPIKEFTVPAEAKVLSDLSYLPNVEHLTIQGRKLEDLNFLAPLNHLISVNLSGCRFTADSLSVFVNLPELNRINLSDCGLSTLSGLAGARKLTHLVLSNNTLRNLEPIADMATLVEVILDHNAVTDLTHLSKLINLQKLDISYNSVTTLAPLSTCIKLNWLNAGNNSIAGLDAINKLPLLQNLYLDHNQLTDITLIAGCTGLKELDISNNAVTEITMLSTLNLLEKFNFSYNEVEELPEWPDGSMLREINGSHNKVKTVETLANLNELSFVYMDYNKLKTVDSLANCYHLVLVNVYGNEINEPTALTDHDIIVNYDPT